MENIVHLYSAQTFGTILFQYPIVFGFVHPRGLRYYAVIGTSAAVYISCHVVLHAVVRPCVVFCACFIFYNNKLMKYVVQQEKTALMAYWLTCSPRVR